MRFPVGTLVIPVLAITLLSGCVIPSEPETSATGSIETAPALPHVDASTYTITLDWVGVSVPANRSFTFPMHVDGTVSSPSTHIGAHYWTSSQTSPTTANALKCDHMVGERRVPNDFDVTCTPVNPGHYYIRGHVQMTRGTELINWWSDEHEFDAHP